MKVYVIYDPLLERAICVHEKEDMTCSICESVVNPIGYPLVEKEFEIQKEILEKEDKYEI